MKRILALGALTFAASCTVPAPTLLATVGDVEIHVADLAGAQGEAAERRLQELISEAQAAEVAQERELDERPDIQAELERTERTVLARALIEAEGPALDDVALRAMYKTRQDELAVRELDLAHIVVRLGPTSDRVTAERARDQAWQKASALYARVRTGVDFGVVAREASEDASTAANGGVVGLIRDGSVDRLYFERAAQLKAEEVSPPFETRFGFFVIKARSDPRKVVPPFEQVRGALSAMAVREARSRLQQQLDQVVAVERREETISKLLGKAE